MSSRFTKALISAAWDSFCIGSIVGIWPRYIEHRILKTSHVHLSSSKLSSPLRILHLSDIHFNPSFPRNHLLRLKRIHDRFSPHLVCFTGDFFCRETVYDPKALAAFFHSMHGHLGSYYCLGNHDYTPYLTIRNGVIEPKASHQQSLPVVTGFKKLLSKPDVCRKPPLKEGVSSAPSEAILSLMNEAGFTLLHNSCQQLEWKGTPVQMIGLGDYWSGHFAPHEKLFHDSPSTLQILLSHNPDSLIDLESFTFDLALCGHTHGRQVNLPFIGKRLSPTLRDGWARGLYKLKDQQFSYTNRGLGGQTVFRWFSPPECTCITIEGDSSHA